MKKLSLKLLFIGMGLITALTLFVASANGKEANKEIFPEKITMFVAKNIPNEKIVEFKHDNDKIKVKCSDGTKLYFNHKFECIKMENEKQGLNEHLINHLPADAVNYLINNYNKVAVSEIELKSYGYKVELETTPNECEILFNKDGTVKKAGDY